MCDIRAMEMSYVLAEHSLLRKKTEKGFLLSAVFYSASEERTSFLDRMRLSAGLDVHVVNTLAGLQHICDKLVDFKTYIIDLGLIEDNLENRQRIAIDQWIKMLTGCWRGKKVDVIFLKDMTDQHFIMNLFQPCDMLLKL